MQVNIMSNWMAPRPRSSRGVRIRSERCQKVDFSQEREFKRGAWLSASRLRALARHATKPLGGALNLMDWESLQVFAWGRVQCRVGSGRRQR